MLETRGSQNASIGSFKYGVLDVLHGPASAAFSGESRRNRSAHSETVKSSGGAKFLTAEAIAALSLFVAVRVVVKVFTQPVPNAFLIRFRAIFVI